MLRRDFFGSPRYRHAQFRELISQNHKGGAPSSVCWFITPLSADVSIINPSWCTCTAFCSAWVGHVFDLHQVWPAPRFAGPRWRTWSNHWRQGLGRLLVLTWAWLWTAKIQQIGTRRIGYSREWSNWRVHGPWHPIFEQHRFDYSAKTWGKRLQNNKRKNRSTKNASMTYKLAYIQFFRPADPSAY